MFRKRSTNHRVCRIEERNLQAGLRSPYIWLILRRITRWAIHAQMRSEGPQRIRVISSSVEQSLVALSSEVPSNLGIAHCVCAGITAGCDPRLPAKVMMVYIFTTVQERLLRKELYLSLGEIFCGIWTITLGRPTSEDLMVTLETFGNMDIVLRQVFGDRISAFKCGIEPLDDGRKVVHYFRKVGHHKLIHS